MTSLSILLLTTVLPSERHGRTGGEIVTAHVVAALRGLGHTVRVIGYGRPGYRPVDGEILAECRPIETSNAPLWASLWFARAILHGQAYSMQKYTGRSYQNVLAETLREQHWDRIILDHVQTAWLLPALAGEHVTHLSHNGEAGLYAERAESGSLIRRFVFGREAQFMRAAEKALASTAQSVWTLTKANAEYFKKLGAASAVVLPIPPMPMPIDFQPGATEYDVGLLGTWSWGPNRAGLDWFCSKVVPLLPKTFKIAIAGLGADELSNRLPNVLILGRVADAAEFLGKSRCIAVPSVAGDGIQIKTLDAISIGRPVIATLHALRGIEDVPERVRIANTPHEFAAALIEMAKQADNPAKDDWAIQRHMHFTNVLKDTLA